MNQKRNYIFYIHLLFLIDFLGLYKQESILKDHKKKCFLPESCDWVREHNDYGPSFRMANILCSDLETSPDLDRLNKSSSECEFKERRLLAYFYLKPKKKNVHVLSSSFQLFKLTEAFPFVISSFKFHHLAGFDLESSLYFKDN